MKSLVRHVASADVGQIWPKIGRHWSVSPQDWPSSPDFGRNLPRIGPLRPEVVDIAPQLVDLARISSRLPGTGQARSKLAEIPGFSGLRSDFGRRTNNVTAQIWVPPKILTGEERRLAGAIQRGENENQRIRAILPLPSPRNSGRCVLPGPGLLGNTKLADNSPTPGPRTSGAAAVPPILMIAELCVWLLWQPKSRRKVSPGAEVRQ